MKTHRAIEHRGQKVYACFGRFGQGVANLYMQTQASAFVQSIARKIARASAWSMA